MLERNIHSSSNPGEADQYAEEAQQRWGQTEAYRQSQEKVRKMTKADFANISEEGDHLMKSLVANLEKGPASPEIQNLINQHYHNLRHFYEPTLTMYKALGEMYVDDYRFTVYYEKYQPGLALFLREAITIYVNQKKQ